MTKETKFLATRVPFDEGQQFAQRCARARLSKQTLLRFLVIAYNDGRITLADLIQNEGDNPRDRKRP